MRHVSRQSAFGRIGGAEVAILISMSLVGAGIMWFPGDIAKVAGAGVATSYLVDVAAMIAVSAAIASTVSRHPGQRMLALLWGIVGRSAARTATVAVAVLDLGAAIATVAGACTVMNSVFLPLTPLWVLEVALMFAVFYSVAQGLEAIGRAMDVVTPVIWALILLEFAVVAGQTRQPIDVLVPHVPAVGGWSAVAAGAYTGVWLFSGLTAMPNICAHLAASQLPRLRSRLAAGIAFAFGIRGLFLALDLLVLGVVGMAWYDWPTVSLLRHARSNVLVNRSGALAAMLLVILVWGFVAVRTWNAAINLQDVFGPQKIRSGQSGPGLRAMPHGRWGVAGALSLIVLLASLAIGFGESLPALIGTWLDPAAVILAVLFPLALWAIDSARGDRNRRRAA